MIIEFNDSIILANRRKPEIRQAVEAAGIAVWRGDHVVFASRKALAAIGEIEELSKESRAVFTKLLNNFATEASFLQSIKRRVEIDCEQKFVVAVDEKWIVPIETLAGGVPPVVLLAENLTDAELYRYAAWQFAFSHEIGHLKTSVSLRNGGGSTTANALNELLIERREWAVCITDSDKGCPNSALGDVSQRCLDVLNNRPGVAYHVPIPGKTLENILPFQVIDNALPHQLLDNWREYVVKLDTAKLAASKHANLKIGVNLKSIRALPESSLEMKFWSAFARTLDIDISDCLCADSDCVGEKDCGTCIVPPLGTKIGEHVLNFFKACSLKRACDLIKSSPNADDWYEIGKAIFQMGLAQKPTRA